MDSNEALFYAKVAKAGYPEFDANVPGYSYKDVVEVSELDAYGRVFENSQKKQMIISFAGTDNFQVDTKDWLTRGEKQYTALLNQITYWVNLAQQSGDTVVFTGHSLGGFIAQLCAEEFQAKAVVFDTAYVTEHGKLY